MRKRTNKSKIYYRRLNDKGLVVPMDENTKAFYDEAHKCGRLLIEAENELEIKKRQLREEFEKTLKHLLPDYYRKVSKQERIHKLAEDNYTASYQYLVNSSFCAPYPNGTRMVKEVQKWNLYRWSNTRENKYGQFFCATRSVIDSLKPKNNKNSRIELPIFGFFIIIYTLKSGKLGVRWEYYNDKWKKVDKKEADKKKTDKKKEESKSQS